MTLRELIPARYRKVLYALYAFVGFAFGAAQVGFATADVGQPKWFLVALAVYAYVGTAFGVFAASNTAPQPGENDYEGRHAA